MKRKRKMGTYVGKFVRDEAYAKRVSKADLRTEKGRSLWAIFFGWGKKG